MLVPSIYEGVVGRLIILNIDIPPEEMSYIGIVIPKVLASINNVTNQNYSEKTLPFGLYDIVVDKVMGELLMFEKSIGKIPSLNFSPVEKQIQIGDTSITYAIEGTISPEKRLDNLINYLISGRDKELVRYRRLIW